MAMRNSRGRSSKERYDEVDSTEVVSGLRNLVCVRNNLLVGLMEISAGVFFMLTKCSRLGLIGTSASSSLTGEAISTMVFEPVDGLVETDAQRRVS